MKQKLLVSWFLISIILNPFLKAQSFEDQAQILGIFHSYGTDDFGGGLSFYDFDQDGWDDLTFTSQESDSLAFFRNTGGQFERIYFETVHHTGYSKQVLWCDYDNDGDKDLLVTGKNSPNYLYQNDGLFNFIAILIPAPGNFTLAPTYGAAFGDIDLDGDLDLFIANRTITLPIPNQLFLNNGNGSLTEIGFGYPIDSLYQYTFCGAFLDYDQDGLPDLYTAEDRQSTNQIYKNMGNHQFSDECEDCGAEIVIDAMCVSPGDYDNDGDLDIYISNTPGGNALLRNEGDGNFTNVAAVAGVGYYRIGWASAFLDYDNDMDLDLYVSGGSVTVSMKSQLYNNQGDGSFIIPDNAGFNGDSTKSFSNGIGDFDNDGYYDIAVSNNGPELCQLWRNSGGVNNWIKIDLKGSFSNVEGVGSWIEVWTDGQKQIRYTHCGVSYLAQHSGSEIIGLGEIQLIDSIVVKWPSGMVDNLVNISANQRILICEGETLTSTEISTTPPLKVYPVPANQTIIIEGNIPLNGKAYSITGMDGKIWEAGWLESEFDNKSELRINYLHTGMYLLRIVLDKEIILRRILYVN